MSYFSNFLFKEEFGVESGVESKLSRIKYWSGVAGQDFGQALPVRILVRILSIIFFASVP